MVCRRVAVVVVASCVCCKKAASASQGCHGEAFHVPELVRVDPLGSGRAPGLTLEVHPTGPMGRSVAYASDASGTSLRPTSQLAQLATYQPYPVSLPRVWGLCDFQPVSVEPCLVESHLRASSPWAQASASSRHRGTHGELMPAESPFDGSGLGVERRRFCGWPSAQQHAAG